MYEPSEQEIREAITFLTLENIKLKRRLEETEVLRKSNLNNWVLEKERADGLQKELDEIKQAHATPVGLA